MTRTNTRPAHCGHCREPLPAFAGNSWHEWTNLFAAPGAYLCPSCLKMYQDYLPVYQSMRACLTELPPLVAGAIPDEDVPFDDDYKNSVSLILGYIHALVRTLGAAAPPFVEWIYNVLANGKRYPSWAELAYAIDDRITPKE